MRTQVAAIYSDSTSGARHNRYAINKRDGVHDSIIPRKTACNVLNAPLLVSHLHFINASVELGLPRFHVRIAGLLCHGSVASLGASRFIALNIPRPLATSFWGKASRAPGSEFGYLPKAVAAKT